MRFNWKLRAGQISVAIGVMVPCALALAGETCPATSTITWENGHYVAPLNVAGKWESGPLAQAPGELVFASALARVEGRDMREPICMYQVGGKNVALTYRPKDVPNTVALTGKDSAWTELSGVWDKTLYVCTGRETSGDAGVSNVRNPQNCKFIQKRPKS